MFIIPGYIDICEEDNAIFITSQLRKNTVKLTDPDIQEEFRSILRCGGCQELSTPLIKFLHEQELLANETEISHSLEQARMLLEKSLLLTIMPTEGCNFCCPYCYENHTPISMRREILDQILKYIVDQASWFKHIQISWFGGEPTLCRDVVLETAAFVQNLQKTHSFRYTSNMTTNGYLLNEDYFKQFYMAGITTYQITLDGWSHDKTRSHVSGGGTLQTILDNLITLSDLPKEQYQFHIILRHNILPGDVDYSWYDHLYNLFGEDDRFSVLVRPVGDWGGESVHSLDILKGEERNTLVLDHVAYLKQIGMQCSNGLKAPFTKLPCPRTWHHHK